MAILTLRSMPATAASLRNASSPPLARHARRQERWAYGNSMDSEHEHDDRDPDSDDEPLEGWPERESQGSIVGDEAMEAFR
jgi:hypothetical protein